MATSIEKEFVPYQESMELKELDFNEPCLGLYYRDKTFYPTQCKSQEEYHGQICMAPTFSQAFRFFREKYKLHSKIEIQDIELDWYFYEILEVKNGQYYNDLHMDMNSKSYEEAELTCLKKLIEIVKNGK